MGALKGVIDYLNTIKVFKVYKMTEVEAEQIRANTKDGKVIYMIIGYNVESLSGALLSLIAGGPTHSMFYKQSDDMIYHSTFSHGVVKEKLSNVVPKYSKMVVRKMHFTELKEDPEKHLGIPYDMLLDYDEHDEENCVEFINCIFGTDCTFPKDFRKISDKVVAVGSNVVKLDIRKEN